MFKSLDTLRKCIIELKNRSLIKVIGVDSLKHLNGLTTNNLIRLKDNQSPYISSSYNAFLSPQGRLLFDGIVSLDKDHYHPESNFTTPIKSGEDAFLIDIDSNVKKEFLDHLKQYKMRNKIDIIDVTDQYRIYSVLDKTYKTVRDRDESLVKLERDNGIVTIMDPRHDIMGIRLIEPKSKSIGKTSVGDVLGKKYEPLDQEAYKLFRLSQGIAEGVDELGSGTIIPLEYNFDLLNGVDFHKGCYLGQELTSRTHFTGLVRKRIFPVVVSVANVESPSVMDEAIDNKPPHDTHLFPQRILNSLHLEHPENDSILKVSNPTISKTNTDGSEQPQTVSRSQDKFITGHKSVGLAMLKLENIDIFSLDSTKIKDSNSRDITLLPPCWITKVTKSKQPIQEVS